MCTLQMGQLGKMLILKYTLPFLGIVTVLINLQVYLFNMTRLGNKETIILSRSHIQ
jgi:hypothetical protein